MSTTIEVWTKDDLDGIEDLGIQQVWTEVDESGHVLREIGIGVSGDFVYVAPSEHKGLGRGLFDNQKVRLKTEGEDDSNLRKRFESMWRSYDN